ncbi:MAG: tyrosine--tRNA ligase [Metallosphaera sp.]
MESRLSLITRNAAEVVTSEELKQKLEEGRKLKGYLGFEPSGLFHIGWLIWAQKFKDLMEAGVEMNLLVATWHAWINDKLGGKMEMIKLAGEYAVNVLNAFGISRNKINVIDAEDIVKDKDYWSLVLKVAKNTSLARMKRALTIMGRKADEAELDSSKLIYPAMQVSDIFYMDLDIALGGTDQRKAHMLARDAAEKLGKKKVIAIHTPLLVGLQGGQRMSPGAEEDEAMAEIKMSKSKPDTAIFIDDEPETVSSKLMMAYCPKGVIENNPVLQINKYILFTVDNNGLKVERESKFGGDIHFTSYKDLEESFAEGRLHPKDLKMATARKLNQILDPLRKSIKSRSEYEKLANEIVRSVSR